MFLSYSNKFTNRVSQLKQALEASGIPCWMAVNEMLGDVQLAIAKALKAAPAIIICYSRSYRDSKYAFLSNLQKVSKFKRNLLLIIVNQCILF